MIRIAKRDLRLSLIVYVPCLIQFFLFLLNSFSASDRVNYAMFIINYCIVLSIILCLVIKNWSDHFLAICFYSCFALFLMGQKPFKNEYDVFLTFNRVQLNTDQYYVFVSILYLALFISYLSYDFLPVKSNSVSLQSISTNNALIKVLPLMKLVFIITLPAAFYMQLVVVISKNSVSYTEGYLLNVNVPSIIKVGYYVYLMIVLLLLALKPRKLDLLIILSSYLFIEGGIQLLQGRRALFATTLLFIIWYTLKYYGIQYKDYKVFITSMIFLLGIVMLFFFVEQQRSGQSLSLSNNFISAFLISTGGSDSVIANTIYRGSEFPKPGIVYLLDPFVNNVLFNLLLGKHSAQGYSYLDEHNSFSHWISYLTEPSLYLSGHGMGSSYLAESYLAFGLLGVIIVSIGIGWLIKYIRTISFNDNAFRSALVFIFVQSLFTLPRDGLFSWVGQLFYFAFMVILIYPFYYHYKKMES